MRVSLFIAVAFQVFYRLFKNDFPVKLVKEISLYIFFLPKIKYGGHAKSHKNVLHDVRLKEKVIAKVEKRCWRSCGR